MHLCSRPRKRLPPLDLIAACIWDAPPVTLTAVCASAYIYGERAGSHVSAPSRKCALPSLPIVSDVFFPHLWSPWQISACSCASRLKESYTFFHKLPTFGTALSAPRVCDSALKSSHGKTDWLVHPKSMLLYQHRYDCTDRHGFRLHMLLQTSPDDSNKFYHAIATDHETFLFLPSPLSCWEARKYTRARFVHSIALVFLRSLLIMAQAWNYKTESALRIRTAVKSCLVHM